MCEFEFIDFKGIAYCKCGLIFKIFSAPWALEIASINQKCPKVYIKLSEFNVFALRKIRQPYTFGIFILDVLMYLDKNLICNAHAFVCTD